MRTLMFVKGNRLVLGVKTDEGILDVEVAAEKFPQIENVPTSTQEVISLHDPESLEQLIKLSSQDKSLFYKEDELTIGPCVTSPQKILCVGLNYRRHADETKMDYPTTPIIFSKFSNALSGHKGRVELPESGVQYDYEAELAIVIGKEGKNISEEDALSYVYGYTNANDLSIRDSQFKTSQWLLGKTSDGFCPVGPYLVSSDEIEDPNNLRIRLSLNGEIKQDSTTSDMIFNCSEIISYISKHMTLLPGDIILTGTPEGVIMGEPDESRVWLKDGDEMTVEVGPLGRLTTKVFK